MTGPPATAAGFDFDLFVIGGGSGGVRAARVAAEAGARVGLAEEYRYGGTCVIRGCIPKKLMVYASAFSDAFEDAAGYGWTVGTPSFDWAALVAAKDAEIARLEASYRDRLRKAGVSALRRPRHHRGPAHGAPRDRRGILRQASPRRHRRPPGGPRHPRRRPEHHLERDLRPRDPAEADRDRRRRLRRLRVRRHHERPRDPRHPAGPRRPDPARLRRRPPRPRRRRHARPRHRARGPARGHGDRAGRRRAEGRRRQRRDPQRRPGALRAPAATRTPQAWASSRSASSSGRTARSRSTTGRRPRCPRSSR